MNPTVLLLALVFATPAGAACTDAAHRSLDFWIGAWEVKSGDVSVGRNDLRPGLDGCVVEERYRQPDGYEGTSLSFYDASLKAWRQTWVDNTGSAGEFRGEAAPGEMKFTGETHRADGTRVLRRMNVTRVDANHVRQRSWASLDGGVTWKPHYDFTYVRTP